MMMKKTGFHFSPSDVLYVMNGVEKVARATYIRHSQLDSDFVKLVLQTKYKVTEKITLKPPNKANFLHEIKVGEKLYWPENQLLLVDKAKQKTQGKKTPDLLATSLSTTQLGTSLASTPLATPLPSTTITTTLLASPITTTSLTSLKTSTPLASLITTTPLASPITATPLASPITSSTSLASAKALEPLSKKKSTRGTNMSP